MSKANFSKRSKLLVNVFRSNLSGSDKLIFYAMALKYIDGEQLLMYLEKNPTIDQVKEYIESHLRENMVNKHESK